MLALLLVSAFCSRADAGVAVIVGPTTIVAGEAKSPGDITIVNERLAFALAVGSPAPYGVPRGAIIDVAPVTGGRIGQDCVVFADFIPNNWSAWPNTFQRIDILERGPKRAVVRTVRDWGKATVTSVYTLESNSDAVEIRTTLRNGGDTALPGLLSGLTLWPKRGYFFGLPGLAGTVQGPSAGAVADRVVAYDEGYFVALHAPYADHIADGSMDMYRLHSLAPGESREFDAWLQVGASGDLKPVIRREIARRHLESGTVHGVVAAQDGRAIETPVVVVETQGKPYAWVLGAQGKFDLSLPVGDYLLYATAKNYSQSEKLPLRVTAGSNAALDFRDLQSPAGIEWTITDARSRLPLDARIRISEGQKPLVEFLGRKTFFTELDRKGRADVSLAPGAYVFSVSSGGGFLSEQQSLKLDLAPGEIKQAGVAVTPLFDPPSAHWYSADLHHHAD